jgi:phosphatidylglycerophosphatase A
MTISPADRSARQQFKVPARVLREPVHLLALGFGAGLAPVAPGTFGSIVGLAFALALAPLGFRVACVATGGAIVAGVWICGASAKRLGVHDHPAIVWDEVAGMMLTMLAAPGSWWGAFAAFALFRLFDIWKPWPIREVDHGMRGGAGIMLDDILAAMMAAGVLLLARSIT